MTNKSGNMLAVYHFIGLTWTHPLIPAACGPHNTYYSLGKIVVGKVLPCDFSPGALEQEVKQESSPKQGGPEKVHPEFLVIPWDVTLSEEADVCMKGKTRQRSLCCAGHEPSQGLEHHSVFPGAGGAKATNRTFWNLDHQWESSFLPPRFPPPPTPPEGREAAAGLGSVNRQSVSIAASESLSNVSVNVV